ncbi:hypothetical protein, partial [Fibrobacter sp.]|uniref:hypothetical protein n=2 Tax=Fibrobacter sp. TaxID=35828 RepID=UPI0025BCA0A4
QPSRSRVRPIIELSVTVVKGFWRKISTFFTFSRNNGIYSTLYPLYQQFKNIYFQESHSAGIFFDLLRVHKGIFLTFCVATSLSTPFSKPSNYVLRLNAPCCSLETANVSFCIATTKEDKPGPANPAKILA